MNNYCFLLFLLFAYNTCAQTRYTSTIETKNRLLEGYRRDTLPLVNNSRVNVKVGLALRAINKVNQLDGTINFNIWFRYAWLDEYLQWNNDIVDRMSFTTDPSLSSSIWIPDIYIYNTANNPMSELAWAQATCNSKGEVLLSRPGILVTTCIFDLSDFPYDQQTCLLKFGSWAYSSSKINLEAFDPVADISNYQENHEWDLISFNATINEEKYNCCPDPYQDITFTLVIRRKPGYFTHNLIIPAFITSSLMILALFIPWNSGERVSFATTIMLTMTVFLLILSEHLPQTNTQSLLSLMFIGLTMLSFIGLFFTILITSLYSENIEQSCIRSTIIHIKKMVQNNKVCAEGHPPPTTVEDNEEQSDRGKDSMGSINIEYSNGMRNVFGNNFFHKVAAKIELYFTVTFVIIFVTFAIFIYNRMPVYK